MCKERSKSSIEFVCSERKSRESLENIEVKLVCVYIYLYIYIYIYI